MKKKETKVKVNAIRFIESDIAFFDEFFSFDSSAARVIEDINNSEITVSFLADMFVDCIWSDVEYDAKHNPVSECVASVNWERHSDVDDRATNLFTLLSGIKPSILM